MIKNTSTIVLALMCALAVHSKNKLTVKLGQQVDSVPKPYYLTTKGETVQCELLYNLVDNIKIDDKVFVPKNSIREFSTGSALFRRYDNKQDVRKIYEGKLTIWSSDPVITHKPAVPTNSNSMAANLLNAISIKPEEYELRTLFFTEERNNSLYRYKAVNLKRFIPESCSAYRHILAYNSNRTKSTAMKIVGVGLYAAGVVSVFSNVGKGSSGYSQALMLGAAGAAITIWSIPYNTKAHNELNQAVAEFNSAVK